MAGYYNLPINSFLRDPPKGITRSAYAVEVNPWVRRGDVEAALFFRGTIVSAYGYIETRLGELAMRCSRLEIYAKLRDQFPYKTQKRLIYLRSAFACGPLIPYEGIANIFFGKFESVADMRHQVAHARMQVMPDWGVTFHDLIGSGTQTHFRRNRMTLDDLEKIAWRAARLSRMCQHLADRLEATEILPKL